MTTPSHYGHLAPTFDVFKNFINGTVDVGSNPKRALIILAHDGIGTAARYPTGVTVGGVAMNATAVEIDGTNSVRYVGYTLKASEGLGTGVLAYTLTMATPVDTGSPYVHGEVMNDVETIGAAVKSAGFSGTISKVVPTTAGQVVLVLHSCENKPSAITHTAPATEIQDAANSNFISHSMLQTAVGASTTVAAGISPNSVWLGFAWALTGSAAAPTALTVNSGPSTGTVGVASSNFVIGTDNPITSGSVLITPNDGGAGGTFTPASASVSSGTATQAFQYTAASPGTKTLTFANDGGLTAPSASFVATAVAAPSSIGAAISRPSLGRSSFGLKR